MLLSNHGASTLGKTLRRPTIVTMTSFDGTTTLSWHAMRSTLAKLSRGSAVPNSSSTLRRNPSSPPKVWRPSHGIVFSSSSRSMSTASAADIMLHSNAEENHIMATSETEIAGPVSAAVGEKVTEAPEKEAEKEAELEDPEQDDLPVPVTRFKMSEELFRSAKTAAADSPESFWSHTLYRGPSQDGTEPRVKVHYCRTKHTTERILQQHFLNKKVLGFDIEWKADTYRNLGAKKNVSLIQLASEDRIGLFHIALYPKDGIEDLVAPTMKLIMEDPLITKVGVSIKADCTRLRKYLNIDSRGLFELSHLYKLVKYSSSKDFKLINKRLVSLATQVKEHLHLPMFKGEVRSSDWSQPLQMDQIVYAASDSYAGIQLFETLERKRKALDPTPPCPYHAEENKPIRLAEGIEIPTDEEVEPEEAETLATSARVRSRPSPSHFDSVTLEVDKLDPDFTISVNPTTTPAPTTRPKPKSTPTQSKSPLVVAASALADEYRNSHLKCKATPSSLRCYFLWYHNTDLSIPDIAALLREVPLQDTTVVNYILEAVKAEKLPFEKERLKAVLEVLPKEVTAGRYKTLARACVAEMSESGIEM